MIIKKVSLKTLLVCTVFSSPLWAMEGESENPIHTYLVGQSPVLESAAPPQSMVAEFSTHFLYNMTEKTKEKTKSAFDIGKKVLSERDLGPLVMGQLESYLTAANQNLVAEFFKPKNRFSQEFDVEALRPLVEVIRGKLCDMIEYLFLKRNLYGYVPGVGKIKIYEDKTVFRLLLETFIPDMVPAKGLMIKVADIGPIRNYLMYKFDEMIIASILTLYQKTTGKLVKQSVEELVGNFTKKTTKSEPEVKKDDVKAEAKEDEEKKAEADSKISDSKIITIDDIPFVDIPKEEVEKEGSHVWEFLQPRLTYLMRSALCDILKPGVESVIKELGTYGQKQIIPSTSITTHYLASMGVASGLFGFWWGVPLGAGGYYAYNTALESFRDILRKRMLNHVDLFVKYHTYNFLPYTPEEHYLYHLNSKPSSDEQDILADEYRIQEKVREHGILKALLQDLTKQTWIGHLISVGDMAKISEFISPQVVQKNSLSAQITMGEIAQIKKRGGQLSKDQEQLLKNLLDFPSYKIKQKELELIKLWGEKNKGIFEAAKTVREKQQVAQDHLINVYQVYGQEVPCEVAGAYQAVSRWGSGQNWELFPLDFSTVEEIIAESVKKHIGALSESDLKLFHEGMKDWQFISHYMETFVKSHELASKKDFNEDDAATILRDARLLKDLPSAYIRKKEKDYIKTYERDLEKLGTSPLGFGLSFAELVEVHKHMSGEQIHQFTIPSASYEAIVEAAGNLLLGEEGASLAINPCVEVVKAELLVIRDTIKRIVDGERHHVREFYANQFIHLADFGTYVQDALKEIPSTIKEGAAKINLEEGKYASLKMMYRHLSESHLQLAIAQADYLAHQALNEGKWQPLADFRKLLPTFVGDKDLRTQIYQIITNHILKTVIEREGVDADLSSFEMVNLKTSKELPAEKAETSLKIVPYMDYGVYDKSDFTGFYICEILNELRRDGAINDSSLFGVKDVKDLMVIHSKIQDRKRKTLDYDALLFAEDHLEEIFKIKGAIPEYNTRLFYGFSEMVDAFKKQQKATLEGIQRQELRQL